ncbi:MAG: hypothetical protein WC044_00985 [Crocinitomicaceae bacterium]
MIRALFTPSISSGDIFRQIKADAIGKDSHRGVTLTYSWLANQVGHFSLGFIPVILLYSWIKHFNYFSSSAFMTGLLVSIFWLVFELYNFLGPLLAGKKTAAKLIYIPSAEKTIFEPAWGNIAFDTFTDLCFFWLGAFSASQVLSHNDSTILILSALFLIILLPARYWFLTKMYLQNTYYPFQFRLSQWTFGILPQDRQRVFDFMDKNNPTNHLLIFGAKNKGKTSLSVGIATELSVQHIPCLYTTATKLYSSFCDESDDKIRDTDLWTWRDCSVLIIDDINPGQPIDDLITPKKFKSLLDANPSNQSIIQSKKIIWVLGEVESDIKLVNQWSKMLEEIGIPKESVQSIQL